MTDEQGSVSALPPWGLTHGVGTDLIHQTRIEQVLERHGQRFVARILTPAERDRYAQVSNPINYLTKSFAAKEALSKALGTGIAQGVSFQDFEITRDTAGAPVVMVQGEAKRLIEQHAQATGLRLSLSDDDGWVQAFAVLT